MFNYLNKAHQASGSPFVVLEEPIRVYKSNYAYFKEKAWEENSQLPQQMTCFLVNEELTPWEEVQDTSGNPMYNLVYFNPDGANTHKVMMNGEEKEVVPVKWDYFNFPAEIQQAQEDGTTKAYKRKWLDGAYRMKVHFPTPIEAEVYDTDQKKEVKTQVSHARVDLPMGLYAKVLDAFENLKEIKENPDLILQECEVSFEYDANASPADKYSQIRVKPLKKKVDVAKEVKEFEVQKKSFEPPASPF